jgi:ZIP family zinc transporter
MSPMVILSLLIPFIGTTLGSAMVFFLKKEINPKIQKILLQ